MGIGAAGVNGLRFRVLRSLLGLGCSEGGVQKISRSLSRFTGRSVMLTALFRDEDCRFKELCKEAPFFPRCKASILP